MAILLFMAALQAFAGPPAPVVPHAAPVAPTCPTSPDPDDVVVCAGDPDRFRLKPLPPRVAGPVLPKAETRVFGNAKVAAETEAASVGGFVSNRAMVRLKVPF